jgi:hypothetical protein
MDRLLSSIKNVSVSDLLRRENIDIESHIFLDNGADGQDIKQFGLQLLALIEENLVTDNEQGIMLFTPYGIQLSWQLGRFFCFLTGRRGIVSGTKRACHRTYHTL